MPLSQPRYKISHSSRIGSLLLESSSPQSLHRPDPSETAYLVSGHMKLDVMSDQVLLRSHVLCNPMSQFPPSIKVTITQPTDECLKDRG